MRSDFVSKQSSFTLKMDGTVYLINYSMINILLHKVAISIYLKSLVMVTVKVLIGVR